MNGYATAGGGPIITMSCPTQTSVPNVLKRAGTYRGYKMYYQARKRRFTGRPIRGPEFIAEGQRQTFLCEFCEDVSMNRNQKSQSC